MLEWTGNAVTDAVIFVSYDDTIGDLAADGLGALAEASPFPSSPGARSVMSRHRAEVQPIPERSGSDRLDPR